MFRASVLALCLGKGVGRTTIQKSWAYVIASEWLTGGKFMLLHAHAILATFAESCFEKHLLVWLHLGLFSSLSCEYRAFFTKSLCQNVGYLRRGRIFAICNTYRQGTHILLQLARTVLQRTCCPFMSFFQY